MCISKDAAEWEGGPHRVAVFPVYAEPSDIPESSNPRPASFLGDLRMAPATLLESQHVGESVVMGYCRSADRLLGSLPFPSRQL